LLDYENAPQEALILYEAKATQEVKEFVVPKSDFGIAPLFEAAKNIIEAIASGTPPECNINGSAGCQKCSHHKELPNAEHGD